jgi:hypothetical protein
MIIQRYCENCGRTEGLTDRDLKHHEIVQKPHDELCGRCADDGIDNRDQPL